MQQAGRFETQRLETHTPIVLPDGLTAYVENRPRHLTLAALVTLAVVELSWMALLLVLAVRLLH